jgi:hypothetical protein
MSLANIKFAHELFIDSMLALIRVS